MSTFKVNSLATRLTSGASYSARGLAVCLSFILAACSTPAVKTDKPVAEAQPQSKSAPQPTAEEQARDTVITRPNLHIAAVGDIMLGTDFPRRRLPPEDASLLEPVAEVLQQADITFGNLEGVLQDGGDPVKRCSNPNSCYLFRTPSNYAAYLEQAGFDVMSLANNHARDFGETGRDSSMTSLQQVGIAHTGRAGDVASLTIKGLKVGIIAFAPYHGSNNMLDKDNVEARVKKLDADHDIVIVSFHGGAEGSGSQRIPFSREIYYGEDRGDVVKFAHAVVDAGADLVIGHGPHVPRAVELYQERLIAYSLGNFATYWGINIRGANGLAPILNTEIKADGEFVSGRIISARQVRPDGTLIDERHAAARVIGELTRADFPNTPLMIDRRGNIRIVTPSAISGAPPEAENLANRPPVAE